jgi:hypothetical protein
MKEDLFKSNMKFYEQEKIINKLNNEINSYKIILTDSEKRTKYETEEKEKIIKQNEEFYKYVEKCRAEKMAEISNLQEQIKKMEQDDAVIQFRNSLNDLIKTMQKIKLTIETFVLLLHCKNCDKIQSQNFVLKCGHSLCSTCVSSVIYCLECDTFNEKSFQRKNILLDNLNTRSNYIVQMKDDIQNVIKQLSEKYQP